MISVKICCLLRYDAMHSDSLLSAFLRTILYLSKDEIICPVDGGSRFLHPVVNKKFTSLEDSSHELIKFAYHILYCC